MSAIEKKVHDKNAKESIVFMFKKISILSFVGRGLHCLPIFGRLD